MNSGSFESLNVSTARAQQVGVYVFATPQQIARGLFLVRRNVNRRQRAGPIENGQLPRVPTVRLHAIPARRGIKAGAITSHGTLCPVRARWSSKPQDPAS